MKNEETLVSIIVPVYGTEAYLSACIESIRRQSYTNLQIVLVDDQSPDQCPEICDSFAQIDSRILVIHQENKGVSGARNTGLKIATGEYILFVDSDDELYPDAVEILLRDAQKYGADIVSATKRVVDQHGHVISNAEDGSYTVFQGEEPLLLSLMGDRNTNSACAKLIKTDFVEDLCFEEGQHLNEDGFFVFQAYMKKPVLVQHNVAVYQYNTRVGSGSRQPFSDRHLSVLHFCEHKKELVATYFPQYVEQAYNMEVRTNLQMLDLLCGTIGKKYRPILSQCLNTVRRLYLYHKPINRHHRMLAWMAAHGLYSIYKWAVRLKYYR